MFQQLAHFLQKKFPFRRERHASRTTTQQIHADFILQILHLAAQRRLRYPKLCRRPGETQCLTNRQKISQMPEFHCCVPLCRKGMAAQLKWYWAIQRTESNLT